MGVRFEKSDAGENKTEKRGKRGRLTGFMNSALPYMLQPVSREARWRRMRGVLPIASVMPS